MKTLRKERETLLTLLEAFVYDPLVDWAVNEDGIQNTNRITKAVQAANEIVTICGNDEPKNNLNIDPKIRKIQNIKQITESIKTKSSEFKPEWRAFVKEYSEIFEKIQTCINEYLAVEELISQKEQESEVLKKQIDYVDVTFEMIDSQHPLKSLPDRFKTYKDAKNAYFRVLGTVDAKIEDIQHKLTNFDKISKQNYKILKNSLERIEYNHVLENREDIKNFVERSDKKAAFDCFVVNSKKFSTTLKDSLPLVQNFTEIIQDYFETVEYCTNNELSNKRFQKYLSWLQKIKVEPDCFIEIQGDLDYGKRDFRSFETYLLALEGLSKSIDKKILETEHAEKDIVLKVSLFIFLYLLRGNKFKKLIFIRIPMKLY